RVERAHDRLRKCAEVVRHEYPFGEHPVRRMDQHRRYILPRREDGSPADADNIWPADDSARESRIGRRTSTWLLPCLLRHGAGGEEEHSSAEAAGSVPRRYTWWPGKNAETDTRASGVPRAGSRTEARHRGSPLRRVKRR